MTPDELKTARARLGLTGAQLGHLLGYAPTGARFRVSEMERGVQPVTKTIGRLVRAYLEGYRPADWPTKSLPPAAEDGVVLEEPQESLRMAQESRERELVPPTAGIS